MNTPSSQTTVPRIARRYTIQCSLPNTHTAHIELDGDRQTGREAEKERGRMEDGREGARGGWEQGNTREGGREAGRKAEKERGRMEDGREGARGGRVGTREHGGGREGGEGRGGREGGSTDQF